ncbi:MAG: type II toxin-antitoxin system VapC family toxin [Lautropia sp.]|nr:type II toxin-antitoxin system VapC family toxin [Lautropia sp.]
MSWLLDTNIIIAISRQNPLLLPRLTSIRSDQILISAVVQAEIEYGIAKSERRDFNRRVFDAITRNFPFHPFDRRASSAFGEIRADLERRGCIIGPYDMMIAAHALSLNATLVTDNMREFQRVNGLRVENWLKPDAG